MSRNLKDYAVITLKGMAMGAADVIPGVSGGTIAFISGIYEELITTISGVDVKLLTTWKEKGLNTMWKELNGNFILALFLGIGISVLSLLNLANYLLEEHPILVWAFFFGLVLASIWYIGSQIKNVKPLTFLVMIIAALIAYGITTLPPLGGTDNLFFLALAGSFAVCAMILPGISGAFILVLLGAYKTISEAVDEANYKIIAAVMTGAIVGLLTFSRILRWLFKNFQNLTLAGLTGFIAGSLIKIWPWKNVLQTRQLKDKIITVKDEPYLPSWSNEQDNVLFAVLLMLTGFFLIIILERIAKKQPFTSNATD
ncbi:DUF368 domain-containing protein [Gangjinia marincola]|uniref:DUF368 domain-containing protein n=1 Tax=Gangjinia marincola TaxID=578463 RepID=A0ABP3XXH1_9FLAO